MVIWRMDTASDNEVGLRNRVARYVDNKTKAPTGLLLPGGTGLDANAALGFELCAYQKYRVLRIERSKTTWTTRATA